MRHVNADERTGYRAAQPQDELLLSIIILMGHGWPSGFLGFRRVSPRRTVALAAQHQYVVHAGPSGAGQIMRRTTALSVGSRCQISHGQDRARQAASHVGTADVQHSSGGATIPVLPKSHGKTLRLPICRPPLCQTEAPPDRYRYRQRPIPRSGAPNNVQDRFPVRGRFAGCAVGTLVLLCSTVLNSALKLGNHEIGSSSFDPGLKERIGCGSP